MHKKCLTALAAIFVTSIGFAQPTLVKNINNNNSTGCSPGEVKKVGNIVFFRASDAASTSPDFELWRTDGTNGGTVKIDISSGAGSGFPKNGTGLSNNNYFVYNGTTSGAGSEMYIYNVSTQANTLVDIRVGAASSDPDEFTLIPNTSEFLFSANDGSAIRLYKGNVTNTTTSVVSTAISSPSNLVAFNGEVYFAADNGSSGVELWKSNGSSVTLVKDINTGGSSNPNNLVVVGNTLYFAADDGVNGVELWKTNGTTSGTQLVKNINTTAGVGSNPSQLTSVNGRLVFVADDGNTGNELFYSDGTSAGTKFVNIDGTTSSSNPNGLTPLGNLVFFSATQGGVGNELFHFDPVAESISGAFNIDGAATSSSPQYITNAYGDLYFSAYTTTHGREVWKWSNGTTSRVSDINAGAASSNPLEFRVTASSLVFFADDGTSGTELYTLSLSNAPTIVPISAKSMDENVTLTFNVFINSAISSLANLTLSGVAADTNIIGSNGFSSSGTGSTRSVSITPKDYQNGTTSYAITVCDNSNNCISTSFNITVNSVNNVPEIANVDQRSVNEDNNFLFNLADFNNKFFDADGTLLDSIRIESVPKRGKLVLGTDTIRQAALPRKIQSSIIGTLRYIPNANINGKDTMSYNAFSGGDWADASKLIIVTINPVNDIPTISGVIRDTLQEDGNVALSGAWFTGVYSDIEASPLTNVRITYLPPNGVLLENADTLDFTDLPKTVAIGNVGNFTYHPDTNYFGTDFILWRASDGTAYSAADTVYFRVTTVNDLPTSGPISLSTNEDVTLSLNKIQFDPAFDDVESTTLSRVRIASLPNNATLLKNNDTVTVNQVFTRIQLDSLKLVPQTNFNGTSTFNYAFRDIDPAGFSSTNGTVTITVNPVNDAPITADVFVAVNEDDTLSLTSMNFSGALTDIENDTLRGLRVAILPGNGKLWFMGSEITSSSIPFDVEFDSIAYLSYTPNADYNGMDYFRWRAFDGGAYATISDSVKVTVNPVNDAPIVFSFNESTIEDISLTVFPKNFTDNFADVDGDTIVHLTFTSLPRNGKIFVGSTEQTSTPFNVTKPQLNNFTYTPNQDFNRKDTINFTGFDGTVNSNNTARIIFTVDPANDTTIITAPVQVQVLENVTTHITGVVLSDVDVDDGDVNVTLSCSNGFMTLNTRAFLSFQNGDGVYDSTMTFSGTLQRVNNALASLRYRSEFTFLGLDFIDIQVSDPGPGTLATDNDEIRVDVQPRPVVFTKSPVGKIQCEGSDVMYSVQVDGTRPYSYQWQLNGVDISGATDDTLIVTSIHNPDTGNYTCVVTNPWGDSTSVNGSLSLYYKPVTDFAYTEACSGASILFSDSTTVQNDTVKSYSWNMDNGTSYSAQNPIHTYNTPNTYAVRLITESGYGCLDTTVQNVVVTPTPFVSFSVSTECEGDTTSFLNMSTALYGNLTYEWSFGNGDSSIMENPSYLYDTLLNYNAVLTVRNDGKCATTTNQNVPINPRPRVKFNAPTVCRGESTNFMNSSKLLLGTNSYTWKYGEGNTSNNTSPSYIYATADTFSVELIALSDKGCSDSLTKPAIVKPFPIVSFTSPNVCGVDSVMFGNNTTISRGGFTSDWKFGDGMGSTLNGSFNYFYSNPGTYNVELVVTADEGCMDSVTQAVTVYPMPNLSFTNNTVCFGETTVFNNTSTILTGVMSFVWDFDYNNSSNNVSPTNTYAYADTFNVELFGLTDKGCTDSLTQQVVVRPFPVVSWSAQNECDGDSVTFINNTTIPNGGFSSYWKFDNGADTTVNGNIDYLYTNPGFYNVELVVTADAGCMDSVSQNVEVYPVAVISASTVDVACFGDPTGEILITPLGGTPPFQYSIDTGATYSLSNHFTGLFSGNYSLTTTDANGCVSDYTANPLFVNQDPAVTFSIDSIFNVSCFQGEDGFIQVATSGGTPPYLFSNDGGINFQSSNQFAGLVTNPYTITLQDNNGCTHTADTVITEPATPISLAHTFTNILCNGDSTGSITITGIGSVGNYSYSIDGGQTILPSNTFTNLGAGSYLMYVVDSNGCDTTEGINLTQPATAVNLTLVNSVDVNCFGQSTGRIDVIGAGGTGQINYGLDQTVNTSPITFFSNLASNVYTVYAQDFNGCLDSISVNITQPASPLVFDTIIETDLKCFNSATGQIEIVGAGGSPSYLYAIDNGPLQPSGTFTIGNGGAYVVRITDSLGCSITDTANINEPSLLVAAINNVTNESCEFDGTGAINVNASGGTSPFEYSIDNSNYVSNSSISNLINGNYDVYVRDANGCISTTTAFVGSDTLLPVAAFNQFIIGNTVSFNNQSNNENFVWWNFGDGTTSTNENPVHKYSNSAVYSVALAATNGCGSDTLIKTVDVNSTGIANLNNNAAFEFYPNPANSNIQLSINPSVFGNTPTVRIFNSVGQIVLSERLNGTSSHANFIDLRALSSGVYHLEVQGNQQTKSNQLIINK